METEVGSGSNSVSGISESREAVTKAAEITPTTVMEMDEDATLLSEPPAKLMLEGVGAVVSARFEVHLVKLMPWLLTLEIYRHFSVYFRILSFLTTCNA